LEFEDDGLEGGGHSYQCPVISNQFSSVVEQPE